MAIESLLSMLAATLGLIFAGFVLDRNPRGDSNKRFALLQSVVAAWLVLDYISRIATDSAGTLLWTRLSLAALAFVGPVFVHFAITFRERFVYVKHLYGAAAVFALLSIGTDLIVASGAGAARLGFGPLALLLYVFLQGTMLFALWRMISLEAELKQSIDKQKAFMMAIGTALPALLVPTVYVLLPLAAVQLPWRPDALAVMASTLLIGYSFFMQRTLPVVKVVRR
jgi:hypothetical protein